MKEVEEALKQYKDVIMQSRVKYEVKKARAARASDGSVLEYGLDYHLSKFKDALERGIPTDTNLVEPYLATQSKAYNLLTQWLDNFQMRYGEYEEAKSTIEEVQSALRTYRTSIGGAKAKIDVMRAVKARRADGSVLEYGLDYHVNDLTNQVKIIHYCN